MDNFYKEHEGYKELVEKIEKIDNFLSYDLVKMVGDAIQYGIDKAMKGVRGACERE